MGLTAREVGQKNKKGEIYNNLIYVCDVFYLPSIQYSTATPGFASVVLI